MNTHFPNSPCYQCGGSLQKLAAMDAHLTCCTSCGVLTSKRVDTQSCYSAWNGSSSGRSLSALNTAVPQAAYTPRKLIKRSASSSAASTAGSTAQSGTRSGTAASSGRAARNSTAMAVSISTPLQLLLPMTSTDSCPGTSGTSGGSRNSVEIASKRRAASSISPATSPSTSRRAGLLTCHETSALGNRRPSTTPAGRSKPSSSKRHVGEASNP